MGVEGVTRDDGRVGFPVVGARAVERVADDGEADVRQVRANLVRATRLGSTLHERVFASSGEDSPERDARLAVGTRLDSKRRRRRRFRRRRLRQRNVDRRKGLAKEL